MMTTVALFECEGKSVFSLRTKDRHANAPFATACKGKIGTEGERSEGQWLILLFIHQFNLLNNMFCELMTTGI